MFTTRITRRSKENHSVQFLSRWLGFQVRLKAKKKLESWLATFVCWEKKKRGLTCINTNIHTHIRHYYNEPFFSRLNVKHVQQQTNLSTECHENGMRLPKLILAVEDRLVIAKLSLKRFISNGISQMINAVFTFSNVGRIQRIIDVLLYYRRKKKNVNWTVHTVIGNIWPLPKIIVTLIMWDWKLLWKNQSSF